MKSPVLFLLFVVFSFSAFSQINPEDFENFKSANTNLSVDGLNSLYPRPAESYYKGFSSTPPFDNVLYLDSLKEKFSLTDDELELLRQNHFFVTERLSYSSFGDALHTIYANDLPLFISTDVILHALHCSYDFVLKSLEQFLMKENLETFLNDMYESFPTIVEHYEGAGIDESLQDVDLYLSVAASLVADTVKFPRVASLESYNTVMDGIENERNVKISLFCESERLRDLDFSQFKVRGHYVYTDEDRWNGYPSLEPYFRAMMWLGRIEFLLTPPADNPWENPWRKEEIRRMNISASLLNEMYNECASKERFIENETIINYMVGLSDNITPAELTVYQNNLSIESANDLLDDDIYDPYFSGFSENADFEQKIMGGMYFSNPDATRPDTLPVSYRLSGQRYIIDSEILANVVYDRIIYENKKVFRGLPDPLDALFALGNSDATYFLEDELNTYHYAPNLAELRYLVDHKEESFWNASLYSCWLGALRALNPGGDDGLLPLFMQTSAWHQQKMNTQLSSWAQLRHDNLLYAKPSYTGMAGCSYPYSYIEPYPEFYALLATFAENMGEFISTLKLTGWETSDLTHFFPGFAETMRKLEVLSVKEIENVPFTGDEKAWLQLFLFEGGGSGAPPYSGWCNNLFVNPHDIIKQEYPVVDIHTQPTDENGAYVGYVLHGATGKMNLGTVIEQIPGTNQYVAYTGAFMSFYEKITEDFLRLTDQDWTKMVAENDVPQRPQWTDAYLAGPDGTTTVTPVELPSTFLVTGNTEHKLAAFSVYPNPVNAALQVRGIGNQELKYRLYNTTGKMVKYGLVNSNRAINFSSLKNGLYLLKFDGVNSPALKVIKQ